MTYAPTPDYTSVDILPMLVKDHREVEALLGRFDELPIAGREEYFCEVVPTLVGHEVAEEEILYPAVRGVDPRADAVVEARIEEQAEAEELLKQMEKLDATGEEFAASFVKLRTAVLDHAQREERTVFPLLDEFKDVLDRQTMGARYEKAKAAAPTHPHPHAPDAPPGNLVLGPVAATVDRLRDAIRG